MKQFSQITIHERHMGRESREPPEFHLPAGGKSDIMTHAKTPHIRTLVWSLFHQQRLMGIRLALGDQAIEKRNCRIRIVAGNEHPDLIEVRRGNFYNKPMTPTSPDVSSGRSRSRGVQYLRYHRDNSTARNVIQADSNRWML